MTTHGLTEHAQRGYLTYVRPSGEYAYDMPGHFYIHGDYVAWRMVGGRNWSAFCAVSAVHSFELYDAEGEKVTREIRARLARLHAQ